MPNDYESFWDHKSFAVITDKTKPAMKWTIKELTGSGKKVFIVDISEKPDSGAVQDLSELPEGVECAVIGVTRTEPADLLEQAEKKGIRNIWIHWKTDTPDVKERCSASQLKCMTGRCPMMYLGHGLNIHTIHRGLAKLSGRY